jgi:hypothetical protein
MEMGVNGGELELQRNEAVRVYKERSKEGK